MTPLRAPDHPGARAALHRPLTLATPDIPVTLDAWTELLASIATGAAAA